MSVVIGYGKNISNNEQRHKHSSRRLSAKSQSIRVTINTAIPLTPALEIPKIKAAKKAKTNDSSESNPFKYASIKRRYNLFLSRLKLKMCAV